MEYVKRCIYSSVERKRDLEQRFKLSNRKLEMIKALTLADLESLLDTHPELRMICG